jgi:hypothetical protein
VDGGRSRGRIHVNTNHMGEDKRQGGDGIGHRWVDTWQARACGGGQGGWGQKGASQPSASVHRHSEGSGAVRGGAPPTDLPSPAQVQQCCPAGKFQWVGQRARTACPERCPTPWNPTAGQQCCSEQDVAPCEASALDRPSFSCHTDPNTVARQPYAARMAPAC